MNTKPLLMSLYDQLEAAISVARQDAEVLRTRAKEQTARAFKIQSLEAAAGGQVAFLDADKREWRASDIPDDEVEYARYYCGHGQLERLRDNLGKYIRACD